jgi:hypothetical protein
VGKQVRVRDRLTVCVPFNNYEDPPPRSRVFGECYSRGRDARGDEAQDAVESRDADRTRGALVVQLQSCRERTGSKELAQAENDSRWIPRPAHLDDARSVACRCCTLSAFNA